MQVGRASMDEKTLFRRPSRTRCSGDAIRRELPQRCGSVQGRAVQLGEMDAALCGAEPIGEPGADGQVSPPNLALFRAWLLVQVQGLAHM